MQKISKITELLNTQVAGYIEPGYGLEGKRQILIDDDDLDEMTDVYEHKLRYQTFNNVNLCNVDCLIHA